MYSSLDVPGQPSAPVVEGVRKETCKLSWTPPEDDGGSPIIGYFVERCPTTSARWLRIAREPVEVCSYDVTELVEDTEYKFRIVAVNIIGESEPGPESQPVTAKDPWGKFLFCSKQYIQIHHISPPDKYLDLGMNICFQYDKQIKNNHSNCRQTWKAR